MAESIGITGLHAADNPAPGIPVARSLRADAAWDGRIIGLAYDALDTGIYDGDILDEVYLIPYPSEGAGTLLARLREIRAKAAFDVLIPNLDSEIANFIRIAPDLEEMGIRLAVPTQEALRMRSKAHLAEFCKARKIPAPRTRVLTDPAALAGVLADLGQPVWVKGLFHGAHRGAGLEEARVAFGRVAAEWGLPVMLQENVAGEEYDVVALGDGSRCVGAVAMRKLALTDKGKAWAGVTVTDSKLISLAREIVDALRWRGPLELEFVRREVDREYLLIEINPRFPAWVYLAAKAGVNLPRMLVDLALGRGVTETNGYPAGLTFVRHATDLICPLNYLESLTTAGELILRPAAARTGGAS